MNRFLLALIAPLILAVSVVAQSHCPTCKNVGIRPCSGKDHDQKRECGITLDHRCDTLYRAACCRGLKKVLCDKCENPAASEELMKELEQRRLWVASIAETDALLGAQMCHVETANFILHFSPPSWREKSTTLSRAKAAHLFAERLEDVATYFEETLGVLPGKRITMDVLISKIQQERLTGKLYGKSVDTTYSTWFGDAARCTQWPKPPISLAEHGFMAHVLHNATHLLMRKSPGYNSDAFPAWFDAGFAHWVEIDKYGISRTYCEKVGLPKGKWGEKDWKKPLTSAVKSRKEQAFEDLVKLKLAAMTHEQHVYCASFLEFMIKSKPKRRLPEFFKELKSTNDTERALETVYGWSLAKFHEEWRAFVLTQ